MECLETWIQELIFILLGSIGSSTDQQQCAESPTCCTQKSQNWVKQKDPFHFTFNSLKKKKKSLEKGIKMSQTL